MGKGGQYQRLLVAIVVFFAELGAFVLLGALSVGVITAQVLLLLLLAFSPVALVAAAVPGRGHQFFKGWLAKLAGFLLRKAAYSLVLAILLAVCAAISAATSQMGWLFSFGLQCAFFWAVFLQRRSLTEGLVGTVTGPGMPGRDRALDAVALYMGARTGTRLATGPVRAVGSRLRGGRGGGHAYPDARASTEERAGREAPTRTGDDRRAAGSPPAEGAEREGQTQAARAGRRSAARTDEAPERAGSAEAAAAPQAEDGTRRDDRARGPSAGESQSGRGPSQR